MSDGKELVRGLTGNFRRRLPRRHETRRFVVHTIKVQSRSSPESTREAMRESEEEYIAAIALAARRITFAITLIYLEVNQHPSDSRKSTHIYGPSCFPFSILPPL